MAADLKTEHVGVGRQQTATGLCDDADETRFGLRFCAADEPGNDFDPWRSQDSLAVLARWG
jgi:hypothetical protein